MLLRDLLNEHKWKHDDLAQIEVVVRHRGAPEDQLTITGQEILEIGNKGLFVAAEARISWESDLVAEAEQRTFIPWHRVLRVQGPSGPLWVRGGAS